MNDPNSFDPDAQILALASRIVSPARANAIRVLLRWKNGGCLTVRERPDIPDVTPREDAAIRAVWKTIPNGSSCWQTALDALCNFDHHQHGRVRMDPDACFSELLSAVAAGEFAEAGERAEDLRDWLHAGGFYPGGGKLAETAVMSFLDWALRHREDTA